jgi:hypothetical protein
MYQKFFLLSITIVLSLLSIPGICSSNNAEVQPKSGVLIPDLFNLKTAEDQELTYVDGKVYGITFDNNGNLYAAKNGNEIIKITPDGKAVTFCKLDPANSSEKTYIWSLQLGSDGLIYASAMDRLLKITLEGKVSTLFIDPSQKLMSVEFDLKGNLYVTSDTKIYKFTPSLEKSLFIDCGGTSGYLGLTDLKFDAGFKNLYVANYNDRQQYKYPLKADGTPGEKQIIFDTKWLVNKVGSAHPSWLNIASKAHPSWFSFDNKGNLYISLEDIYSVLKIGGDNSYTIYEINKSFFVSTIAFGQKGFDPKAIYTTGYKDGKIHKMDFSNN